MQIHDQFFSAGSSAENPYELNQAAISELLTVESKQLQSTLLEDRSSLEKCLSITDISHQIRTDLLKDVCYTQDPLIHLRVLAQTSRYFNNFINEQLHLEKNPSFLLREDLSSFRATAFCWDSNKSEIFIISNPLRKSSDALVAIIGNIEILRGLILTQNAYRKDFIFKRLAEEIPELLPVPKEQTNYVEKQKDLNNSISNEFDITRIFTESTLLTQYNQQLLIDEFYHGQIDEINEWSRAIKNRGSHQDYQGVIFTSYLLNAINTCDIMHRREFMLPCFVKGTTSFQTLKNSHEMWNEDYSSQKKPYNCIFKIQTDGAEGFCSLSEEQCVIDCYSKYQYIGAKTTPLGLMITLKLLPKDKVLDMKSDLDPGWIEGRGSMMTYKLISSERLFRQVKSCIASRYFQSKQETFLLDESYEGIMKDFFKKYMIVKLGRGDFNQLSVELIELIGKKAIQSW